MQKFLALSLIFGLAAGGIAFAKGNADAGGKGLETLRLGVMTDSITAYVGVLGVEKGIFEKNGLKVEVATFAAGINTIDAVTIGQMDIGFGADFAVLNRLGGSAATPLRVFTGLGEGSLDSWKLWAKGDNIKTPADLRGKPVVTRLGTVEEYWHARTFSALGIDPKTINFVPVDATMEGVALIQGGKASAMWANARAAESLEKLPGVHPIADLSAAGSPTVSIAVATEDFLKNHQSIVVKYLKATQEVYDYMADNPQEAAETIYKANSTPVNQTLANLKVSINYIKFDKSVFDALQGLYNWIEAAGVVKNPYNLRGYINVDALKALYPDRANF